MQHDRAVLPGGGRDRRRRLGLPLSAPLGRAARRRSARTPWRAPDPVRAARRRAQRAEVAPRAGRRIAQGAREQRQRQVGAALGQDHAGRAHLVEAPVHPHQRRRSVVAAFAGLLVRRLGLLAALGVRLRGGLRPAALDAQFLKKRREAKFLQAFPDAVDVIVRGIKAGLPLLDSLKIITADAPEPVKSEFRADRRDPDDRHSARRSLRQALRAHAGGRRRTSSAS